MNNKYVQLGIKIFRIIIPIILIYILIWKINWKEALTALRSFPVGMFIIAVLLFIFSNLLFSLRWFYLLNTAGSKDKFSYILSLVFYSLFLSNFLPTTIGGDLVKIIGVVDSKGSVSRTVQISTIIADRGFSFLSKLLLLPLTIWYFRGILTFARSDEILLSSYFLSGLPKKMRKMINKYLIAIRPWFQIKHLAIILSISWTSLMINGIAFWVIVHTLNPTISYLQVFGVMILTYFVGLLPISLNGIGVQEGSITYLLVLSGLSSSEGIAAALLTRLMSLSVSLMGGIWLLVAGRDLLSLTRNRQKDATIKEE